MDHAGKVHLFIADSVRLFISPSTPLTIYNLCGPSCTCYAASQFDFTRPPPSLRTRGHRFSVTSAVATEDSRYLFTAGKEGSIIKWDLHTGARLATLAKVRPESTRNNNNNNKTKKGKGKQRVEYDGGDVKGHTDEVLALAVSGDGRYLASAGKDRRVGVWDVEKAEWVKGFGGHRDTISVRKSLNSYSFEASGARTHAHVHLISLAIVARIPERNPATIFRVF